MILPPRQVEQLRAALEAAKKPLFFFDDDPDGLCSFLLLYRFVGEGHGVIVKTTSCLTKDWVRKIAEYTPDVVFVLDVPVVEQEFIDAAGVPVYWIDHHMPVERQNIHYFNPRLQDKDAYIPTTRMAYEVVQQDSWIAAVGCVADWYVPDFLERLEQEHPGLLPRDVHDPETAMYGTPAGTLARMLSFLLKGKSGEALKCVKIIGRIQSPAELLEGTTPGGAFLRKRFLMINEQYCELLANALKQKARARLLLFRYDTKQWSYTSELSNELARYHPDKVVLVCREKDGEYKCSLRARATRVLEPLQQALAGVQGHGGGHEYACGAVIKSEDFDRFVEQLEKGL